MYVSSCYFLNVASESNVIFIGKFVTYTKDSSEAES